MLGMSAFCRRTTLTRDAVRLYVRIGLLHPVVDAGNRYQRFGEQDVERAQLIRAAQSLGYTLKQILAFDARFGGRGLRRTDKLAVLDERLAALDIQLHELRRMRTYLTRKRAWVADGEHGVAPPFSGTQRRGWNDRCG
ncbi:MAG: helix-turn-helix domain-containing protein [Metallibacterium scheffleri]|jgi:DNA-binding transcriptional MerR regulator